MNIPLLLELVAPPMPPAPPAAPMPPLPPPVPAPPAPEPEEDELAPPLPPLPPLPPVPPVPVVEDDVVGCPMTSGGSLAPHPAAVWLATTAKGRVAKPRIRARRKRSRRIVPSRCKSIGASPMDTPSGTRREGLAREEVRRKARAGLPRGGEGRQGMTLRMGSSVTSKVRPAFEPAPLRSQ
ncbi:hypothetical protein E8A74_05150 [Polyangium fumosum]|uniref:Uncharacterized protein n=1 Tax=Polyangium fumosum TaxID=889272 RepID=A0A4U1JHS8_9BACT|nr:hypothetical protein E8A74_05150 [Polyangium fumosum]